MHDFGQWDKIRDLVDHTIDMMVNFRQSGHPGGSRSKSPLLVAATLSGAMRFDLRRPGARFADRLILVGGHAVPVVYALLAVYNEALRIRFRATGDRRFRINQPDHRVLYWEDLLDFRRRGGLSGHAEMEGKTLFLGFNTGPSGHGAPAALGEALALKMAGAEGVRVFALDGEGGLTPGVNFEVRNAAWGYGLDNLYYLVDWNDFGIDSHRVSDVVPGAPADWFQSAGFEVHGAEDGEDWEQLTSALQEMTGADSTGPAMMWAKTRKGRGYGKYDYASHGSPHSPMNCEAYWETKRPFTEKYGIEFDGFGQAAPEDAAGRRDQVRENLSRLMSLLARDEELCNYLAERLVDIGDQVPRTIPSLKVGTGKGNPWQDKRFFSPESYPADVWAKPGDRVANRHGLARWGSYVNALALSEYGRPLFIGFSADLADSTGVAGFAGDFSPELPGAGKYSRGDNPEGTLMPSVITEFANAGACVGMAAVNLAKDPFAEWDGLCGACSTYGSFSYLKYGMMRLFSQLTQDCELKLGKTLWIAGHSGPETADDSRTHFGIFSPGCTQLFPRGQVINCYPWEYNEVPVMLAAALRRDAPIVALHLTRPPIEVPDREALGIPSHFEAGRGAYVLRPFRPGRPKGGTVLVQGTLTTMNVLSLLPVLDREGPNVKLVAAVSPELFALQEESYRNSVLPHHEFMDSTFVSNQARVTMQAWCASVVSAEYSMTPDYDDRWRTGGTIDEVAEEAGITAAQILEGLRRFADHRRRRLARVGAAGAGHEESE